MGKKKEKRNLEEDVKKYLNRRDYPFATLEWLGKEYSKEQIQEALRQELKKSYSDATTSKISYYDLREILKVDFPKSFLAWSWKRRPFALSEKDYNTMLESVKGSLYERGEIESQPLYQFKKVYQQKLSKKHEGEIHSNDLAFFADEKNKVAYAKTVNMNYKPVSEQLIEEEQKGKSEEEKKKDVYRPELYSRNYSITLYVLLDGTEKKAHPILRYDSTPYEHRNTFLQNDKRKEVFGQTAQNPHFHFQNADDDLLCLKRNSHKDGQERWSTGRCNAIDCPHLIKYLYELDEKKPEEIQKLVEQNMDYGMPFLYYKNNNKYLSVNIKRSVSSFVKGEIDSGKLNNRDVDFIKKIASDFKQSFSATEYATEPKNDRVFPKLIRALAFLDYINKVREKTTNIREIEILSNLEIEISNATFEKVANLEYNRNKQNYNEHFKGLQQEGGQKGKKDKNAENELPVYHIKEQQYPDEEMER